MWIVLALLSALFAGITSILAKCGIRKTDSTVATAIRTIIVLAMAIVMTAVSGSTADISSISPRSWLFLVLSGLATGCSWLCYFRALQIGEVSRVVAVDKSSTVLSLLLAFLLLDEKFTVIKAAGIILIAAGTVLTLPKSGIKDEKSKTGWLVYAAGSAIFAALTSILGKIGIEGVESNLGTAVRTFVVLIMAWIMVLVTGKTELVRKTPRSELLFICLSGFATGASWLCYYRALQTGTATAVIAIDKLSILVTLAFSYIVFKEKPDRRSGAGIALITVGTLVLALG